MEADGPDMAAVREILGRTTVDFYYTMANFHCPTNVTWSPEKRRELLELAREDGFTVIEDDCLSQLYFDGTPRRPLWQEDQDDSVLYLDSFSKCLVPGMRLGYVLAPKRYEKRLLLAKFNTDVACPAILQETLAVYLDRGLYERHLEALRAEYVEKRSCLLAALREAHYLSLPYAEHGGGVFFWVRLRRRWIPRSCGTACGAGA